MFMVGAGGEWVKECDKCGYRSNEKITTRSGYNPQKGWEEESKMTEGSTKLIRCRDCNHYWYAADAEDMKQCTLCHGTNLEKKDAKLHEGDIATKVCKAIELVDSEDPDSLARELLDL